MDTVHTSVITGLLKARPPEKGEAAGVRVERGFFDVQVIHPTHHTAPQFGFPSHDRRTGSYFLAFN